jgi:hypothetical protein
MRKITVMLIVVLVAIIAASAAPQAHYKEIHLGTNTSGSASVALTGYLEAVYVEVSDNVSTGTIAVSYTPIVGSNVVNVATNAVTDQKIWRPRVDLTDVNGDDLTSDAPDRHVFAGETITFNVSGSPTNLTWKCLLVIDK